MIGLIISALTAYSGGLFWASTAREVVGGLSDCFVVSGTLLSGVGGLLWISGRGGFDMLFYGAASLVAGKRREGFYEYRTRQEKKRAEYHRTLLVGVVFLFIGMILCACYCL